MRQLAMMVVLASWVAPGAASAQLVPGARLGYAFPAGELARGVPMSDGLRSQVPVQLELGWRVVPRLVVGASGAYGIGQVGALCTAGATCSGAVIGLGVQATWRFTLSKVSPWAGAGLGYEWARYRVKAGSDTLDVRSSGPELLRLMGGVDFVVGEGVAAGPFVQWGMGRFVGLETTSPLGHSAGAIPDRAIHSWFTIGLRGTFESLGDQGAGARQAERAAR
jgi:hypothetical protein